MGGSPGSLIALQIALRTRAAYPQFISESCASHARISGNHLLFSSTVVFIMEALLGYLSHLKRA